MEGRGGETVILEREWCDRRREWNGGGRLYGWRQQDVALQKER